MSVVLSRRAVLRVLAAAPAVLLLAPSQSPRGRYGDVYSDRYGFRDR